MIINFYKLKSDNFIKTICQLIEKAYNNKYRILVKTNDEVIENDINRTLWTYSQKTFIPHGSSKDPLPDVHPVYITSIDKNPNNANLKFFVDNFETSIQNFEKLLYVFTDSIINNESSEKLYNKYINKGLEASYHVQENLGWSKL